MMRDATVYLDHNATTPPAAVVVQAMVDVLQHTWANASSSHAAGQAARSALIDARARVARFLGCQSAEVVFTSGATEANHTALRGALAARREAGRHRVLLSAVEHPGLIALAQQLRDDGVAVDLLPVDRDGRLDLVAARAALGDDVALACVMAANNETGVLMPIAEMAALVHACGAWLHVDATQLAGKEPLSFAASGADLMSVSAHKFGGPQGVGALLVRRGIALAPLLPGRQERGRRGGTENLPGIVGMAAACDHAASELHEYATRVRTLRDRLQHGLVALVPALHVYGELAPRVPNTLCVRFGALPAEQALTQLARAGIVASSGAACSAGGTQPSDVLLAMGEAAAQARGGVRFSLGAGTTAADIDRTLAAVSAVIAPLLQPDAPVPQAA